MRGFLKKMLKCITSALLQSSHAVHKSMKNTLKKETLCLQGIICVYWMMHVEVTF